MRILAIHGVGHGDAKTDWQPEWAAAMGAGLQAWNPGLQPQVEFLAYDRFFEDEDLNAPVVAEALIQLSASGLFHGIADLFRNRRGLGTLLEDVRWTAGMVAQWVALEGLRARLRAHLAAELRRFQPELIVAHSLGSLIAYDTLRRDEVARPAQPLAPGCTLLTMGSQIGNPAVRTTFGGRIEQLESLRFWWHLYNQEDDVFTSAIDLPGRERFRQVDTHFDIEGLADHDGAHYLNHEGARQAVWQDLAASAGAPRSLRASAGRMRPLALAPRHVRAAKKSAQARPQLRALLVGIADYPDAASRLEGPVNDVFSVSAALQELGFPADGIRVVLNDRATTAGIRERLRWLLADARPADQLFFYFAGHGAQVPGYGVDAEVDRADECLVPYDFDWSQGRAITDDEFCALYSQLPYQAHFTAVLDCCHSGGMARAGGAKARGLTPPDDIRHRMIRWDAATSMWLPRERFTDKSARSGGKPARLRRAADREAWVGRSGGVQRLGRGSSLWMESEGAHRRAARANGHLGAYTPVLLEACREGELAYEYRHGVTSHGAFTYALCQVLREAARSTRRTPLTYAQLVAETARRIKSVVDEPQNPQLVCPRVREKQAIPGLG